MRQYVSYFDTIIILEKDVRKTAEEMDEIRQRTLAYEYLCHLEEAKKYVAYFEDKLQFFSYTFITILFSCNF